MPLDGQPLEDLEVRVVEPCRRAKESVLTGSWVEVAVESLSRGSCCLLGSLEDLLNESFDVGLVDVDRAAGFELATCCCQELPEIAAQAEVLAALKP